ncbi:MAG: nicotinate (nicotinamide) nucleotide adenylyltransferase [Negativicutes bacterium]|nr:nicotinate (nicotinamide) nucleotide adenylyltransferase [Negativicutes bacterium]
MTAGNYGILGGAFDPVHNGHLFIADYACRAVQLEKVIFVPTLCPPHRSPAVAPFEHRCRMVELATAGDRRFEASDAEQHLPVPSFSLNTVNYIGGRLPAGNPVLIIGYDNFLQLPTWHRVEELLVVCRVIVLKRTVAGAGGEGAVWQKLPLYARQRIEILPSPRLDISSSLIRRWLSGSGTDVRPLLPPPVWHYIRSNGLYDQ